MKRFKLFFPVIIFLFFGITNVYAQGDVFVHFGPSFPVSDFADDDLDNQKASGASIGVGAGVKYVYPFSDSGLGWFCGIDFHYNGLKRDVREDLEEVYRNLGLSNASITFMNYINIPISTGINYTLTTDDNIAFMGDVGPVLNILKNTDLIIENNGQEAVATFKTAANFGLKISGGILINNTTAIEITYFGLGEHDVEGEMSGGGMVNDFDGDQVVSMVNLSIGFKL